MQSEAPDFPVLMPNGARRVNRNVPLRTGRPRDMKYLFFERATGSLQNARLPEAHITVGIRATHCNLLIPSIWVVTPETERVIHCNVLSDDLLEVVRSVMLRPNRPAQQAAV